MLILPAYAKVNLCLAVLGRRPDGFHELSSVAVAVDWHDLVGVEVRAATASAVRLRIGGGDGVPDGPDNLAARAATAVAAVIGPAAIDVWLAKKIPSLAGLGGGSTDAAAVLRGSAQELGAGALGEGRSGDLDDATLGALAASLGSDVPLLLGRGAQRMAGRGERLCSLDAPVLHLAVALAGTSGTAATYAAVEVGDCEDGARIDRVAEALGGADPPDPDDLGSGLEPAACRASPELGECLAALRAAVPHARWHLTGSGGAVFSLASTRRGATDLAAAARVAGFPARACRTVDR